MLWHPSHFQVVIHKRQQYPGMLMSRKALSVGKQNFLQLSGTLLLYSDELRMLPYSNRKCLYPEERHLKFFDQYDLLSCKRECVVLSIVENCECLPYFYRRLAGTLLKDSTVCKRDKFINSCRAYCAALQFE